MGNSATQAYSWIYGPSSNLWSIQRVLQHIAEWYKNIDDHSVASILDLICTIEHEENLKGIAV